MMDDRWQLKSLLASFKLEATPSPRRKNLARLRGIAKNSSVTEEDYSIYLADKYKVMPVLCKF